MYNVENVPLVYRGFCGVLYSSFFGMGEITIFILGLGTIYTWFWQFVNGIIIFFIIIYIIGFLTFAKNDSPQFLYIQKNERKKAK